MGTEWVGTDVNNARTSLQACLKAWKACL